MKGNLTTHAFYKMNVMQCRVVVKDNVYTTDKKKYLQMFATKSSLVFRLHLNKHHIVVCSFIVCVVLVFI